jgi:hypothetical protein
VAQESPLDTHRENARKLQSPPETTPFNNHHDFDHTPVKGGREEDMTMTGRSTHGETPGSVGTGSGFTDGAASLFHTLRENGSLSSSSTPGQGEKHSWTTPDHPTPSEHQTDGGGREIIN